MVGEEIVVSRVCLGECCGSLSLDYAAFGVSTYTWSALCKRATTYRACNLDVSGVCGLHLFSTHRSRTATAACTGYRCSSSGHQLPKIRIKNCTYSILDQIRILFLLCSSPINGRCPEGHS